MLLFIEDRVFTIFLKPIGDVCYKNENESTRVQLPQREYFHNWGDEIRCCLPDNNAVVLNLRWLIPF